MNAFNVTIKAFGIRMISDNTGSGDRIVSEFIAYGDDVYDASKDLIADFKNTYRPILPDISVTDLIVIPHDEGEES